MPGKYRFNLKDVHSKSFCPSRVESFATAAILYNKKRKGLYSVKIQKMDSRKARFGL